MPIFKARFTKEHEAQVEAEDVVEADKLMRHHLKAVSGVRLLGVMPLAEPWPDADLRSAGEPSRPAPAPPGGTPGTPVIRHEDQPTVAVAA